MVPYRIYCHMVILSLVSKMIYTLVMFILFRKFLYINGMKNLVYFTSIWEKYQIIPKSFCVAITTPGLVKCQISRHRYLAVTEILKSYCHHKIKKTTG